LTRRKKKKKPVKIEIPEEGLIVVNDRQDDAPLKVEPKPEEPTSTTAYVGWKDLTPNEIIDAIAELPEANQPLTQRWYGETFLPTYTEARAKLRKLAGLE